jgi:hypothetical protein
MKKSNGFFETPFLRRFRGFRGVGNEHVGVKKLNSYRIATIEKSHSSFGKPFVLKELEDFSREWLPKPHLYIYIFKKKRALSLYIDLMICTYLVDLVAIRLFGSLCPPCFLIEKRSKRGPAKPRPWRVGATPPQCRRRYAQRGRGGRMGRQEPSRVCPF